MDFISYGYGLCLCCGVVGGVGERVLFCWCGDGGCLLGVLCPAFYDEGIIWCISRTVPPVIICVDIIRSSIRLVCEIGGCSILRGVV